MEDLNLSKISEEILLEKDVEIKRVRDQCLQEVESLNSRHMEGEERLKIKHTEEVESLQIKHRQDLELLQNKSIDDIAAQQNKYASEIRALEDSLANNQNIIELMRKQIDEERSKCQGLHEQLSSLNTQLRVPFTKKAYLMKEGHIFKTLNKRFFVLEAGLLAYYVESTSEYPYGIDKKGEMPLRNVAMSVDGNRLKLSPSGSSKHLQLEIKASDEREEWRSAIQAHIDYCYALRQA